MSTSKIRIKLGAIEVEFEGSEEFVKNELTDVLAAVSKLHKETGGRAKHDADENADVDDNTGNGSNASIAGTTANIAAKLGCNSGPQLITAAAAQLTFVGGKDEFTTKELSLSSRSAKSYWKRSYGNNFHKYLSNLVNDQTLNEVRSGVYALQAKKKSSLESTLASA